MSPPISVIIPAHNESVLLTRGLEVLHDGAPPLEVVVVCNGCTDDTAEVARSTGLPVRVIEIPEPSKAVAVRVGNAVCAGFPRVHLDADVELSGTSLDALVAPIIQGRATATAARRVLSLNGCSLVVRSYYAVWERLPQVRSGLFGRGVFALSKEGQARVSALPTALSDDLVVSDAFTDAERLVVNEAIVTVHPPRRTSDLLRRRVRVITGNRQADELGLRRAGSATTLAGLVRLGVSEPRLLPRIPVFLAVTLTARLLAGKALRTNDYATWHRDESSRQLNSAVTR